MRVIKREKKMAQKRKKRKNTKVPGYLIKDEGVHQKGGKKTPQFTPEKFLGMFLPRTHFPCGRQDTNVDNRIFGASYKPGTR